MATKTKSKKINKSKKVTKKPFTVIVNSNMPVSADLLLEYGLLDTYKGNVQYYFGTPAELSTSTTTMKKVGFFRKLWNRMFAA